MKVDFYKFTNNGNIKRDPVLIMLESGDYDYDFFTNSAKDLRENGEKFGKFLEDNSNIFFISGLRNYLTPRIK